MHNDRRWSGSCVVRTSACVCCVCDARVYMREISKDGSFFDWSSRARSGTIQIGFWSLEDPASVFWCLLFDDHWSGFDAFFHRWWLSQFFSWRLPAAWSRLSVSDRESACRLLFQRSSDSVKICVMIRRRSSRTALYIKVFTFLLWRSRKKMIIFADDLENPDRSLVS